MVSCRGDAASTSGLSHLLPGREKHKCLIDRQNCVKNFDTFDSKVAFFEKKATCFVAVLSDVD